MIELSSSYKKDHIPIKPKIFAVWFFAKESLLAPDLLFFIFVVVFSYVKLALLTYAAYYDLCFEYIFSNSHCVHINATFFSVLLKVLRPLLGHVIISFRRVGLI